MVTIQRIREAVAEAAPHYPILRVELFGSYATGHATEDSDVDVLIKKTSAFTLFDMCGFELRLEKSLGVHVDVVIDSPQTLSELHIERRMPLYVRP